MSLQEKFKGADLTPMQAQLREHGKQYGLSFNHLDWLSNTKHANIASEYAKEVNKFNDFHLAMFKAVFEEGKNIGEEQVVAEIAASIGLDGEQVKNALNDPVYIDKYRKNVELARRYGVTGTPTFIINNKYKLVGAQPYDVFRNALQEIWKKME